MMTTHHQYKLSMTHDSKELSILQESHLLAYYDCIGQITYAHLLRSSGVISDTECAQIHQAFKEIILLATHGEFLNKQRSILKSIDEYLVQKLHHLGSSFISKRSSTQRLQLSLFLFLREYSLRAVELVIKIINALLLMKTTEELQTWDFACTKSCFKHIEQQKQAYLLFERYPVKLAYDLDSFHQEKQIAAYLGLHNYSKDVNHENYKSGKVQAFYLNDLVQLIHTLGNLSSEISLLIKEQGRKKTDAQMSPEVLTDAATDLLMQVMETHEKSSNSYEQTLSPSLEIVSIADHALISTLKLLRNQPRKKIVERSLPQSLSKLILKESNWLHYRQRLLYNIKCEF